MEVEHILVVGAAQGLLRHPVGGQQPGPLRDQVLLPHGGPDVAVDHVRAGEGALIAGDLDGGPGLPRHLLDLPQDGLVHAVDQLLGPQPHKVHPHFGAAVHPGVAHVVAHIPGKYHLHVLQRLGAVLLNGHHVRQYLGRMVRIRKPIPHGHAGMLRQLLHDLLVEAPVLDAVKEPAQYLGGVLHALLLSHLAASGVQIGDVCPLLGSSHLKGAAGPGRGLLKEQYDVFALQGGLADARPALGLQVAAQVQQISDLQRGEVHQCQKALAFQIDRHRESSSI